jgi:hypothetical protein
MRCTGCGQTLRVGDEHAGKQARCPACGTIVSVPVPGTTAVPSPAPESAPLGSPFAAATQPGAAPSPWADEAEPAPNPYASPMAASYAAGPATPYGMPHRGGVVLGLGICSVSMVLLGLCCNLLGLVALPLGIVAWALGASDLKKIKQGRMDPSGQGRTLAGMVMGIVSTALCALGMLAVVAVLIFKLMQPGAFH